MTCIPGTFERSLRFHPEYIPLRDKVVEEAKANKKTFNKMIMAILKERYGMEDTEEEKQKTVTR